MSFFSTQNNTCTPQETGRMQLVDENVHGKVNHTDGNKIWGNGD
ncbi:HNH endonuclease [Paenibacillus polymyxa]